MLTIRPKSWKKFTEIAKDLEVDLDGRGVKELGNFNRLLVPADSEDHSPAVTAESFMWMIRKLWVKIKGLEDRGTDEIDKRLELLEEKVPIGLLEVINSLELRVETLQQRIDNQEARSEGSPKQQGVK